MAMLMGTMIKPWEFKGYPMVIKVVGQILRSWWSDEATQRIIMFTADYQKIVI